MRRLIAILAGLLSGTAVAAAECQPGRVEIRGDWGRAQFNVEIADTAEERARGLMHRDNLASSSGMLFLYEKPQRLSFWMRNTLIELDIIFVDERGVVQRIHERAQPLDETAIFGGRDLIAALEINGGLARRLGIDEGSELRHPFFGSDAAWPC